MTSETRMVGGISGIGAGCSAVVSRGGEPPKPPAQPASASAEITTAAASENCPRHPAVQQAMARAPLVLPQLGATIRPQQAGSSTVRTISSSARVQIRIFDFPELNSRFDSACAIWLWKGKPERTQINAGSRHIGDLPSRNCPSNLLFAN